MGRRRDARAKIEFGDFQTPPGLAAEVCGVLRARGLAPRSIVEPTCGTGSLLLAALAAFPGVSEALGADVNEAYVEAVRAQLRGRHSGPAVGVEQLNFFEVDWPARMAALPQPLLLIGNPPWVTSSDLGCLQSHNLPEKTNFHGRSGLDAVTGKSNFDISEWMLIKLLSWLDGKDATLAMLCKTSVARKVLAFGWRAGFRIGSAAIYRIDSAGQFGASVDACLLVCELGAHRAASACSIFEGLDASRPGGEFGFADGGLVADTLRYQRWKHLMGVMGESPYRWRSGIKHDCAAVMELRRAGDGFENRHGETVALEEQLVYPMLKSSELAREGSVTPSRVMILTQRSIGEDTSHLQISAPRTWRYLARHRASFDRRGSAIYRGKPPYSIFGVGDYTFAPWKVAISGLYKKLRFRVVGPEDGKPVVLDDTGYFLACRAQSEAELLWALLSSDIAREFFAAFLFWDAKRPITSDLLRRLDLRSLARELGKTAEFERLCVRTADTAGQRGDGQPTPVLGEGLGEGMGEGLGEGGGEGLGEGDVAEA
jgi:SAM-dependent methyltransferase